jgi:hypothetical protein
MSAEAFQMRKTIDKKEEAQLAEQQPLKHSIPAEVIEAHRQWMSDGTVSPTYAASVVDSVSIHPNGTASYDNFCGRGGLKSFLQ